MDNVEKLINAYRPTREMHYGKLLKDLLKIIRVQHIAFKDIVINIDHERERSASDIENGDICSDILKETNRIAGEVIEE